jgi:hypothetical protein
MLTNGYNSRISPMKSPELRILRAACSLLVLFTGMGSAAAATWSASVQQLARKIVAITGPGAASIEVVNRSSLSKNDVQDIQRQMLTHLASLGLRFVSSEQAAAIVAITLSENFDSDVWVAEIRQGTADPAVVMVSTPRSESWNPLHAESPITLHKTSLWSQSSPVLDVAVLDGNPPHFVILEPDQVLLYRFQEGRWQMEQALPITHAKPWPRDLRGRLVTRKDHLFDVSLPGVFCQSGSNMPLMLHCRESDDSWPLGSDVMRLNGFYAPARNFFTGVLVPGVGKQTSAPAFYSAAGLPRDKYTLWLFATVSGQIHMLDGVTDQTAAVRGWGDELASIRTPCGTGAQLLVSRNKDGPADAVQAYEMADREPTPVGEPSDMNGRVTALWTAADGTTAFGVSYNAESGRYEAFRLSISCTQ